MSRLPDSEPGASPPSEAPRSPAKAPRPPAKAPRPSEPRAFLCDPERALASGEFELLARTLERRRALAVGGLWGASQALCLAVLSRRLQGPWLALVSTEAEGVALASDLEQFGAPALRLASRGDGARGQDDLALRERLITAQILCGPPAERPRLLVASVLSMLERVPEPGSVEKDRLSISKGQRLNLEELLRRLVDAGYTRVPLVERPGELSLRGEILDVFPFASELPLRSRCSTTPSSPCARFDPAAADQRRKLNHVAVCLARDRAESRTPAASSRRCSRPPRSWSRSSRCASRTAPNGLSIQSASHQRALTALRAGASPSGAGSRCRACPRRISTSTRVRCRRSGAACGSARELTARITADGTRARRAVPHGGRAGALEPGARRSGRRRPDVELRVGAVAKGFRFPALALIVVDHHELAGITGAGAPRPRSRPQDARAAVVLRAQARRLRRARRARARALPRPRAHGARRGRRRAPAPRVRRRGQRSTCRRRASTWCSATSAAAASASGRSTRSAASRSAGARRRSSARLFDLAASCSRCRPSASSTAPAVAPDPRS
jgi:hypothetical protein